MKWNLKNIMTRAWEIFRKNNKELTFGECLHRAWMSEKAKPVNEAIIAEAKADWKKAGFEVIHGSKALFGCDLIYASKGDGAVYKARFFGASQVQAVA